MVNNFCFHVYVQKSLSHPDTLSRSLTHSFSLSRHAEQLLFSCLSSKVTLSLSHWLTLDMLNIFWFHVYAPKSLSHSLIHSLSTWYVYAQKSLSLSHSLPHPLIQSPSTCWTTFVFIFLLKSHFLTLTLSHSHILTFSLSHSLNLSVFHSLIHSLSTIWTIFVLIIFIAIIVIIDVIVIIIIIVTIIIVIVFVIIITVIIVVKLLLTTFAQNYFQQLSFATFLRNFSLRGSLPPPPSLMRFL